MDKWFLRSTARRRQGYGPRLAGGSGNMEGAVDHIGQDGLTPEIGQNDFGQGEGILPQRCFECNIKREGSYWT